ncbi:MAG: cupin domain-containing protein [Desulfovermiculus sp.]|nr:cupin domain-containing protein [Desulfovermiculus sp.]
MVEKLPVIFHEASFEEGWDDEYHGCIQWRTLFSNEYTPTEALTAGVAQIHPGDQLKDHSHEPPELYYILAGEGVMTIEGNDYHVKTNTAVFIPGNTVHGIRNTGLCSLRLFYVFAANSFSEVQYKFQK